MTIREIPNGLSDKQYGELQGFFSFNGYYYGHRQLKRNCKYYKSKTVRFDDTFGGVTEINEDEYIKHIKDYIDKCVR